MLMKFLPPKADLCYGPWTGQAPSIILICQSRAWCHGFRPHCDSQQAVTSAMACKVGHHCLAQVWCPLLRVEHPKAVKGQEPEPTELDCPSPQCQGEARQGCPVPQPWALKCIQLRAKQPLVPKASQAGWWELRAAEPWILSELCLGKRQQLRKELLATGTEQPPCCPWSFINKPVSPHRPDLTFSAINWAN